MKPYLHGNLSQEKFSAMLFIMSMQCWYKNYQIYQLDMQFNLGINTATVKYRHTH